jgi:hypothetical protein
MSQAAVIRAFVHREIGAQQNREAIALNVLRDIRFNTLNEDVKEVVEFLEERLAG